jgi:hypothetical protein
MNRTVKGIGVDTGMILVADVDYLKGQKNYDPNKLHLGKTIKVANGNYEVNWHIKETYNGEIEGNENIEVTGGEIVVIDPCYVLQGDNQEAWLKWLKDNKDGDEINDDHAFVIAEMGGDGEYTVDLELNKLE